MIVLWESTGFLIHHAAPSASQVQHLQICDPSKLSGVSRYPPARFGLGGLALLPSSTPMPQNCTQGTVLWCRAEPTFPPIPLCLGWEQYNIVGSIRLTLCDNHRKYFTCVLYSVILHPASDFDLFKFEFYSWKRRTALSKKCVFMNKF